MHLYGLLIGLSFILILSRLKNTSTFFQIGLGLSSLIGARLYHVADYWSYYSQHFNEIFYTWNGGLGIYGALISGLLFILLYSFTNHKSYISYLDSITSWLPLAQSIGRIGNFLNQEISIWWLESFLCIILFILIQKYPKYPTAKYLVGYGTIRFLTEYFRYDTWVIFNLKFAQMISLVFIFFGVLLFSLLSKKTTTKIDH